MPESVERLLPPKPRARLRIYVYAIDDAAHAGQVKVGQTTGEVAARVRQQVLTANVQNYRILWDTPAERADGTPFSDFDVRARLLHKGFRVEANETGAPSEWVHCSLADVRTAVEELRTGGRLSGTHHLTFRMRPEQQGAVDKTLRYFRSIWAEDGDRVPRFLWNAKMRFGKTFAAYELAKRMGAMRVLVVTFKPAVEDSWQHDLESHVDFDGWQFFAHGVGGDPTQADPAHPMVYFGSFQDLLGRDRLGNVKAHNEWIHAINWDLVVFDEYHFGAWRDRAKELFEGEDPDVVKQEMREEFGGGLQTFAEEREELNRPEGNFLPITTRAYLYLSGAPFKALATGEFIEEQIFNWTYTDEQRAKRDFDRAHPGARNPYAALPEMRLLTYQVPDELVSVAREGEFDEFDLNAFFEAHGSGRAARFVHEDEVRKWLDIIRGAHLPTQLDAARAGTRPPFPYSDVRLLPYLQHSVWFLPDVAACEAMRNLLESRSNVFWHPYCVLSVAGTSAGVGLKALPPVRQAIGSGFETQTITLTCGKLTTGVTVPQWSAILMLRNLSSPETYFQAAFRVQSPWVIDNPNGDDPDQQQVLKPVCFVFDFAPTRALRQLADYGTGLAPEEPNPEKAVGELVQFLPVLAYDGSNMTPIDAGQILDIAVAGTSGTLLAKKWESPVLVNVDNSTLDRIRNNPDALAAVMRIEGFRALGRDVFETVINKSESVKAAKKQHADALTGSERRKLTAEEKEYKTKRKQIQEKLIKFAARIPAFMYLTDFRENTLQDVITKLEPDLFTQVTGLTVDDFDLLVSLGVFNATQMNQAIFAFRRYEDASLSYTGIDSHPGLRHIGLYDTVVAVDAVAGRRE